MSVFLRLRSLCRNLIHRDRVERDLDDELRAAFDGLVDEHVASGMDPARARRAATVQLGQVEALKDHVRDARAGAFLDAVLQDARYGARSLRRNPLFALTATLSLAIGIGATTTIFTIANALLLRAAPGVDDAGSLVEIVRTNKGRFGVTLHSHAEYLAIRERVATLSDVHAYQLDPQPMALRGPDGVDRVFAANTSLNYFTSLGVPPAIGRVFQDRVAAPVDEPSTIVLSHLFWTRRFRADPAIVGQPLYLNGRPFVVAGVAREGFRGLSIVAPDLWMPMVPESGQLMLGARLEPDVTRAQAAAELAAIGRELARQSGEAGAVEWTVASSSPLPAVLRGVAAGFIGLLMALVSLVLLIASFNLTGVLLARATTRRREMAVRAAIGAGRSRLVRQLLTETALLFLLGAATGIVLARLMTSLLVSTLPAFPVPLNVSLPLDGRVLLFALAVSLIAALLAGLAPALHASRTDVVSALKDESQGPSDRLRLRNAFVVAQVAFSILLVVTAGLLGRALGRVAFADRGFDHRNVDVAAIDLSMAGYTETTGRYFAGELADRLRRVPGVEAVAIADQVPGGPLRMEVTMRASGAHGATPAATPVSWTSVEPGYFAALRIPLIAGRDFSAADRAGMPPVVIVDESTARRLWPGEPAVGKILPVTVNQRPVPTTVIGVARDLKYAGGRNDRGVLVVYAPLQQRYRPHLTIMARTVDGQRAQAAIRALVTAMNPNLPILTAQTLETQQTAPVMVQLRVSALVSGGVGLAGLLLASIGVYGVTAYTTSRRTREIGIRLALGARRREIVGLVLRQGLSLVALGGIIGLSAAAVAGRLMAGRLFGLPPLDALIFGGAVLIFAAVGLGACYVPARRATQLSAVDALRYE